MSCLEEEYNCSICLTKINKNEMKLDCGHKFHKNCIKKWLISEKKVVVFNENDNLNLDGSCPLCRKKFCKIFISDLDDENFNVKIKFKHYPLILGKMIHRLIFK